MKRRAFTLFEIMLCLALLALVAGVLGGQVKGMIDLYRFKGYGPEIGDEIEKLQILAMTYGSDMQLEVVKKSERFVAIIKTEEPALQKSLNREISLSELTSISWNRQPQQSIRLTIFSTGRVAPTGILGLHRTDYAAYIDLSMPLQIKLSRQYPTKLEFKIPEKPKHEAHKPSVSTG